MRRPLSLGLILFVAACAGGGSSGVPHMVPTSTAPPQAGLYVANVRDGNVVHLSNTSGSAIATFQGGVSPSGVGVTSTGDIAVAGNHHNVLLFHPGAATPFSGFSADPKRLCATRGIALDGADNTYIADPICSNVVMFARGTQGSGVQPTAALHIDKTLDGVITAFDVDPAGTIYVLLAKSGGFAVEMFQNSAGGYKKAGTIDGSADFPKASGLTVNASADIFISNNDTELVRYDKPAGGSFSYILSAKIPANLCGVSALRAAALSDGTALENFTYAANRCEGPGNKPALSIYGMDPAPSATPDPLAQTTGDNTQLGFTDASFTIGVDQSGGAFGGTVYEGNPLAGTVNGYCQGCTGDAFPSQQFSLGYPGMDGIQAIWFAGGLMYTTDSATPGISVYAAPSNATTGTQYPAAIARILGSAAHPICGASYTLTDAQGNVYVTLSCDSGQANYVAKYPPVSGLHGDTSEDAFEFADTKHACSSGLGAARLCNPQQMAFDKSGNLYVTNYGQNGLSGGPAYSPGSIVKYSPSGALLAIMTGPDIHNPSGIAIDPQGNLAVLSNVGPVPGPVDPEIAFFAPPANQTSPQPLAATPFKTIRSAALGGTPFPQLVIDADGTVYVNEFNDVAVFAPGASGSNVTPQDVFNDPGVLTGGTGLALLP